MPFSTEFIMPYLPFSTEFTMSYLPLSTKFIMPYLPFSTEFTYNKMPFPTIFQQFVTQSQLIGTIQVFPSVWERCPVADGFGLQFRAFTFACYDKRPKSNLIKKIESGDRDIYKKYISYHCYKGKPIPNIERRRKREFQLLYILKPLFKEPSLKQSRKGYYCKTKIN